MHRPLQLAEAFWFGAPRGSCYLLVSESWGNLLRIVPPQKKGDFLKFCFYSTLKVSNITLMVLGLKSNSWASSFLLTLSVIANYLIMSRRYLLLFF